MGARDSVADVAGWALDELRGVEALVATPSRVREAWFRTSGAMDRLAFEIGRRVLEGEAASSIAGSAAVGELRGVLRQSHLAERMLDWPRGYPGDFETIDLFYRGVEGGTTPLGCLVDRWIRRQEGPRALLRRPANVARLITEAAGGVAGRVLRVLVVASGPLAEGFEFLGRWPGARVVFTCLDVDANAHAFVRLRAEERGVADRIVTHTCNVLKLAAGKESLDLPPQDLAYSIGLNDYLQEAHSIRLLNWMHRALAPGGTAVLGNLTKGTEAEFAASVLNWPLEYRTREDLERLFGASAFAASAAHWTDDATGCQLYHSASR